MASIKMKNAIFPEADYHAWEQAALKALKNQSLETLYSETYEGIKLSPIYTKKDIKDSNIRVFSANNGWKIAQKICNPMWNELIQQLKRVMEFGQETISFDVDKLDEIHKLDFTKIELSNTPLLLFTKYNFPTLTKNILQVDAALTGAVACDLISSRLEKGYLFKHDGQTWRDWRETISKLDEKHPRIKTILIDCSIYHNSGANAVQELAASLAEAIFYIEEMRKIGWEPHKTINKMIFHFSIGSNFFMEVAKLRAFRSLWRTVSTAYEVDPDQNNPLISAETSAFTKSLLDPHTNILRSGNEAFAAAIGGVDFLHVTPFNGISDPADEFSMRIARNTQLLLREEAFLDKVIDPAGGSFYIEAITSNLIERAWELFQTIDGKGGIYPVLQSGWFQTKIKETLFKKMEDIRSRKKIMIGVNIFTQDAKKLLRKSKTPYEYEKDTVKIEPLEKVRLAEKYESGEFS
ncbi:methylmalonyl-CoA mutase family protein [Lederbergia panacisoli]|uniref:methylmalonyl-CoA mutase family protein n=1 Tax=Lederbergia panacisoli TaxID=1255251 RepID=UPI00214AAA56|nr:methylmalonyl-CoA mutase family protein [Lederbergia panacisoli]MCR2820332.1 methylmalonyl-CoA mutase family protein [Lederbergia panacisoli]